MTKEVHGILDQERDDARYVPMMKTEVDVIGSLTDINPLIDDYIVGKVVSEDQLGPLRRLWKEKYNKPADMNDRLDMRFRFRLQSLNPGHPQRKAYVLLQVIDPKSPELPMYSAEFPVVFGTLAAHAASQERSLQLARVG